MKEMSNAVMGSVVKMNNLNRGNNQDQAEDGSHLQSSFSRVNEEVRRGGEKDITV